jgi:uncharacterized membrane protein YsdA (DUF1294 family)
MTSQFSHTSRPVPARKAERPRRAWLDGLIEGLPALAVVLAFAVLLQLAVRLLVLPGWLPWCCMAASGAGALAMMVDRSAQRSDGPRVADLQILMIALAGGWPGILLARHALDHRRRNPRFNTQFAECAWLNVVALGLFASPLGALMLR